MKMHLMVVALVSVVAACGGSVQQGQEPAPASVEEALAIGGTQCGDNVCGTGTYCCNSSCGICAPKGGACPDVMCEDPTVRAEPKQEEPAADVSIGIGGPCGENYCGKGYFCCNASCGVCAPAGGGCPQVVCEK